MLLSLVHAVFVLMLFIPNVLLFAQFRVTSPFQCALSFSIHVAFNINALDLYSEIKFTYLGLFTKRYDMSVSRFVYYYTWEYGRCSVFNRNTILVTEWADQW